MKAKFITESEIFKGKSEEDLYNDLKDINPLYAKIVSYISTHYTNWSPQVSTTVENFFFRFDPREWPISFNYMGYRIHYEQHNGKVVLGIANDKGRYDYYIIKDFNDFINLMRNKGGRPAIEPARKNIRKVKESIGDLLKGKTEEEIEKNLDEHPDYKIVGPLSHPTEHLRNALYQHNIAYARYALKRGAKPLDSYNEKTGGSSGNLWIAFHESRSEELIIEMLQHKQIQRIWSKSRSFRVTFLSKAIYMGMQKVVEWVMNNLNPPYNEVLEALKDIDSSSDWNGYLDTESFILKWLQKNKPMKESVGDILKPKSRDEIRKALEYTEEEEYADMVDREIDRQRVAYGDEIVFSKYRELVKDGFENKTPPSEVAHNIIENYYKNDWKPDGAMALTNYYKNDWKPDGAMALTNTGGIELKVVDSGNSVEFRFTGEIIPHGAEIEYDYRDQESDEEVGWTDEDEREAKAFFKDEHDNKWYLEDFMRIDYPYFG